ncbi:hypothetical protein RJ639_040798 [Escallonia herrerae]|uniref:Uncharacterized protein n=1 Tax=Escallonia herrerae TaxID=1293975 RepID=A0AA89B2S9_9ASTE|nr:hypothetical protein RJ639_040798 [Escallonia herrerae]
MAVEYIATIEGAVNKRHLIAISEGTIIDGVHCTPDAVELLPQQRDISRPRLRIVKQDTNKKRNGLGNKGLSDKVHEGRNHEVRELVKKARLQIHSLKRVRIGAYRLPPDLG